MDSPVPTVAVRGSAGIDLYYGPPDFDNVPSFRKDSNPSCKTMAFSSDGKYFAWVAGQVLKIAETATWKILSEIQRPKICSIAFSPLGTYLMTWEPFTVSNSNPQGAPNLHIFKSDDGSLVKDFIHKKQIRWEPQWSSDEKLCARLINTDVIFYEDSNFEKIVHRISCVKTASFSLAPGLPPYNIVCYISGIKGQPALSKLFKYPNFEISQSLANKSYFQADKLDVYWTSKGTSALLMASTEVDKTGESYYGKQSLHFLSTKGDTTLVVLSKEGPIYSVQWSPKNTEFCVVYGFTPAKATLFNLKCEPIFDFGTGPRNSVYYNVHGNIILLGGFGNLRGGIELWDAQAHKLISKCDAPDTTQLQWSPDGVHFITATTAPRLRISNGYKIWHYSGALLYERPWDTQEELYEVSWQVYPKGVFKQQPVLYKQVEGIAPSQPLASKQIYRPPGVRGRELNYKLHDDEEPPSKPGGSNPSKAALKQKKKREAQKARRQAETEEAQNSPAKTVPDSTTKSQLNVSISLTGDQEKDKKIKNIKKKLEAIVKLKEQQASGKQLEKNQISKISTEAELLNELRELSL